MRRRALCSSMGDNTSVRFPAELVASPNNENSNNLAIANYFLNNYPDMVVGYRGNYTPITEIVEIVDTSNCNGTVIGVAKWSDSTDYVALLFYTMNSIRNFHALKVYIKDYTIQPGVTGEWFYD